MQLDQYETTAARIEAERDYYYKRLFTLEEACKDKPEDSVLSCAHILNVIYDVSALLVLKYINGESILLPFVERADERARGI